MRFADAGRAEKNDVLVALDEGEAGKFMDLLARHTRRKAEVKAVERLDCGKAGQAGEHLAGYGSAGVTLGAQDFFEKVGKRGHFGGGAGLIRVDRLSIRRSGELRVGFLELLCFGRKLGVPIILGKVVEFRQTALDAREFLANFRRQRGRSRAAMDQGAALHDARRQVCQGGGGLP